VRETGFKPLLSNGSACVPLRPVQYLPRTAFVAATTGRMSFGGFNKETERQNQERVDRERRVKAAAAAARSSNTDVSEAEMAEKLGGGRCKLRKQLTHSFESAWFQSLLSNSTCTGPIA
jgi:hypothetical protein